MKQLRYLENVELQIATKTKQTNGSYISDYNKVKDYQVSVQKINDEVSVSIYGSNITKMYRISSVKRILELYLEEKVNNKEDNISKYFILYKNILYKIKAVNKYNIDIEAI